MNDWKKVSHLTHVPDIGKKPRYFNMSRETFFVVLSSVGATIMLSYYFFPVPIIAWALDSAFYSADLKNENLEYSRKHHFFFSRKFVSEFFRDIPRLIEHPKREYS